MKCSNCGANLSENTNFCPHCGHKIEFSPENANDSKSFTSTLKGKAAAQWHKLSLYGKVATVAIIAFSLLFVIALLSRKPAAIVIAIIQIALSIVAILIHKGMIKVDSGQRQLKWLILIFAILLTGLNIKNYSQNRDNVANTDNSSESLVSEVSESIETAVVPCESTECIGQDYLTLKSNFDSAGFSRINVEEIEDLTINDTDKLNTVESISIAGKTDFTKDQIFNASDEVIICYHTYAKCNVTLHIDFVPNLIFSQYDVELLLNDIPEGTLSHGEDQDFELSLDPGEYTLTFQSDESSSVEGEVSLTVDSDLEAAYKITCYSDKVSIETLYVDRLKELADGEVKLDVSASEYKYENYEDVTTALQNLGFTDINYKILYDIVLGWTESGEVDTVSIAGTTDFKRGDIFSADDEITITYHMPAEDDPNNPVETESPQVTPSSDLLEPIYPQDEYEEENGPVFYSTNDYETAKQGNTGVFSYRNRGSEYDIYWIIDFDEGYVYYFTDGNGNSSCERTRIDSGTLNDSLVITYHNEGDEWSYTLHFKYKNQPNTLIMVEPDGNEREYSSTDLDNALKIRNQRTITDY